MKIAYVTTGGLTFGMLTEYLPLLPPERQEKIMRYRFEEDKLRSLLAGLLIRRVTGGAPLRCGEHGKPLCDGVNFSVSHSGELVAIAVGDCAVGLDVEQIPPEDRLKIADRFYHPAERAYVRGADDPPVAFCEIWTRKEAVLKMTGEGIATDLTAFDTTAEPLSGQLFTTRIGDYCLSLCAEMPLKDNDIQISKLELKELRLSD